MNSIFMLHLFVVLRTTNTNLMTLSDKPLSPSDKHQKMARYAKAMGHPIRIFVLELLSRQSCCYSGDLTEVLPIAKSTLSQHLKELKDAGLIQGEIKAPRIKYCLNKDNWEEAKVLLGLFFENNQTDTTKSCK